MEFKKLSFYCSLNYAGVSMTLLLFCTPAIFNKHNRTFIKLGTNYVNRMTSWSYCFPCCCFSLKETENVLNILCKIKIYFTRENIAFYDHS